MPHHVSDRRQFVKRVGAISAASGIAGLAGCAGDEGDEITLDFNSPAGEESIQGLVPTWFSEYVEELNVGIEIETYFGGELGGHNEAIDNVASGALDMHVSGYALYGGYNPLIEAFTTPYLFDDPAEALEGLDRENNEAADEILTSMEEEHGIRLLGPAPQGIRRITTTDTPVREPSDLEGLTLRAVPTPVYSNTVQAMGPATEEVDQPEIPTALATGTVDGQENPYNIIYGDGIYEHQNYVTETNHMITLLPMAISDQTYQDLTPEQQDAIHEAADRTGERGLEWWENETENIKNTLREEGLEIIEEDEIDHSVWEEQVKSYVKSEMSDEFVETVQRFDSDW